MKRLLIVLALVVTAALVGCNLVGETGSFPRVFEQGVIFRGKEVQFNGPMAFGCTTITSTDALTSFTPATPCYIFNAEGTISVTFGTTGVTAGTYFVAINQTANDVTFEDTNVRTHDGAAEVIGQYDTVGFLFDGTSWIQLYAAGANT